MTNQELQERISKKENQIVKIEKRISKWTDGMNDEAKSIVANCEVVYNDPRAKETYATFRQYKDSHKYDSTVFNPTDWNKGPNLNEAYYAYRDLAEAKATLVKYQKQLNNKKEFENSEKVEVIWKFLQNWRVNAYNFFVKNAHEYYQLKLNYKQAKEEYFKENPINDLFPKSEYYSSIHPLSKDISLYNDEIDEEKLNKVLDREVEAKYTSLVKRITEKAGNIKDAKNLYIANDGEINGIVVGKKASVKIETITAGGYNIQCLHFRVLVHIVK